MCAGRRNDQECLYLKVYHMTILHYQFTHGISVFWHNGCFWRTFTEFVSEQATAMIEFMKTIFHNFQRGLSQQECIDEPLYGNDAPSYSTVMNWFNEFNCGRRLIKDQVREGPWSPWVREHWCRAWTDNARSSCDIPWDRAKLGDFIHQHTLNTAWTTGHEKDFFSRWLLHDLKIA